MIRLQDTFSFSALLGVILLFSGCFFSDDPHVPQTGSSMSSQKTCSGFECAQEILPNRVDLLNIGNDLLKLFPDENENLPVVNPMGSVRIFDGETYKMTAGYVQQEIDGDIYKRIAYNGQIPGPVLQVVKGSDITIEFNNALDIPVTFSPPMDAVFPPNKNNRTLYIIQPGEHILFPLRFPSEGSYWYSSLVRRDYSQEMGLSGLIQVLPPPTQEYWSDVNKEEVLVFDDFLPKTPFFPDVVDHVFFGRIGDVLLINNRKDFSTSVKQGDIVRFFLGNISNGRSLDLSFGERTKLVGGEYGQIEKEYMIDRISLSPGERKAVEVFFPNPGEIPIMDGEKQIGTVLVSEKQAGMSDDIEQMDIESLIPLRAFGNLKKNGSTYGFLRSQSEIYEKQDPEKELWIESEVDEEDLMQKFEDVVAEKKMNPEALLNVSANNKNVHWVLRDIKTRKKGTDIQWKFTSGDLVKIRIHNSADTEYLADHVLHIDGQRFLVLSKDGKIPHVWQWQDTVKVSKGEVVDILVAMETPGLGMIKSQIPEHQHTGMMMFFQVEE